MIRPNFDGNTAYALEIGLCVAAEPTRRPDATGFVFFIFAHVTSHSKTTSMCSTTTTPVIVLSGFLGAGKTTLMAHILTAAASGTRLGCIVNDLATVNVDESTLVAVDTRSKSQFVSLSSGCVCCDGGAGFAAALEALDAAPTDGAAGAAPPFDAVLVECTGVADPAVAAAEFTAACCAAECTWINRLLPPRIVTVVDAVAFWTQWDSSLREATGSRPLHAELLAKQVESAHAIVLNKASALAPRECTLLHRLLAGMSRSGAPIVRTDYSRVPLEWLLHGPDRVLPTAATASPLPVRTAPRAGAPPPAKRQRYGITSFVFQSAARPFHPVRLIQRVVNHLPVKSSVRAQSALADARGALATVEPGEGSGGGDAGTDTTSGETGDGLKKKTDASNTTCRSVTASAPWERLVRSKGTIWLASQHASAFVWSHAGVHFSLREGAAWPQSGPQSTLALIGVGLDQRARAAMETVLTSCLLTDAEYARYAHSAKGGAGETSREGSGAADAAPAAAM